MVILKMAWFLFIALFPLWFGIIGGLYVLYLEHFTDFKGGE